MINKERYCFDIKFFNSMIFFFLVSNLHLQLTQNFLVLLFINKLSEL